MIIDKKIILPSIIIISNYHGILILQSILPFNYLSQYPPLIQQLHNNKPQERNTKKSFINQIRTPTTQSRPRL